MGVDNFQYGHDTVGYFIPESTAFSPEKATAASAFRATSITLGQAVGREFPDDYKGTRSRVERITGRTPVQPWSASGILRLSGSAGTAPEIGDILKHAFGTETVNGSTSVVYTFLKDPSALTATIYAKRSDMHEGVYGAIVQTLRLTWSGDGFVRWEASGIAKDFFETGNTLANGAGSSATALVVDDADFFAVGSLIQIGGDDNSGAGFQVTAVAHGTETLTIDTAHTWSDDAVVAPFLPTPTYDGNPLFGTDGSLSLDNGSSTIKHIGGSFSLNTGLDLLNTEYGDSSASDVVLSGLREVTGQLDFFVKKDETYHMGEWRRKVAKDLKVAIGTSAGDIATIDGNQVQIDPGQRDSPDTGMQRYSGNVVFLATSAGENEASLTLT
jgi:hypothetical protein